MEQGMKTNLLPMSVRLALLEAGMLDANWTRLARATGYSAATVVNVLTGERHASRETKERIYGFLRLPLPEDVEKGRTP